MNKEEGCGIDTADDPGCDYLTVAEVTAAISALSLPDQWKLRKAAHFIGRTNGLDTGDELLQEALVRSFEGRRQCPRRLPIVPFLFGAMRSIASSAAKSARRSPVDRFAAIANDGEADEEIQPRVNPADSRTPEREVLAKNFLQRVDQLFEDDADAQMVIYAMGEGFKGQGLRHELGLSETQHDTIRKRINRRLDESLAQVWRAR